jgi:hypothetical protein
MAKIAPPVLFSKLFGVAEADLSKLGVFDATLNLDSLLFPDPLLLERSDHPEMRAARKTFDAYFERVMILLHGIKQENDKVWRTAFQLLSFPEVKGTCLGYGANSISGSGSGPQMTKRLLETGRDVVRMGIDDPDLFMAMGLFEEDFGPDLIGDMLTNVALGELIQFNVRIINKLSLPTQPYDIRLKNGKRYQAELVRNPTTNRDVPLILMPKDILRALPIATDWREVQQASAENVEFREGLNDSIAEIWSKKSLESKDQLKRWALSNPGAFGSLLDLLHGHDGKPYDFLNDPHGELIWRIKGDEIANLNPLPINKPNLYDESSAIKIVEQIIDQFKFLIEKRDLWRDLYASGKPRFEKASQRMFYVIAHSYCQANGLDITPEAETGRGPVDFKLSVGINTRILVEIKLSTNKQVMHGYEKQLTVYAEAEKPIESYYVVINVGGLGKKEAELLYKQDQIEKKLGRAPKIIVIDGTPKNSASIS